MERVKVLKFGGSSLVTEASFFNAVKIAKAQEPCVVIVSAPGRRFARDVKVTDLLYGMYKNKADICSYGNIFEQISTRFTDICRDEAIRRSVVGELGYIYNSVLRSTAPDYAASRGEYLSAKIFSYYSGYEFADATDVLEKVDGAIVVNKNYLSLLKKGGVVVPGFYHGSYGGNIATFGRGGSDLTGAVVARDIGARDYLNFTDVDGVSSAPPDIVSGGKIIKQADYRFLYSATFYGADVVQAEAVSVLANTSVRLNVRNTFNLLNDGSVIERDYVGDTSDFCIAVTLPGSIRYSTVARKGACADLAYFTPVYTSVGSYASVSDVLSSAGINYEVTDNDDRLAPKTYAVNPSYLNTAVNAVYDGIKKPPCGGVLNFR